MGQGANPQGVPLGCTSVQGAGCRVSPWGALVGADATRFRAVGRRRAGGRCFAGGSVITAGIIWVRGLTLRPLQLVLYCLNIPSAVCGAECPCPCREVGLTAAMKLTARFPAQVRPQGGGGHPPVQPAAPPMCSTAEGVVGE